MNKFFSAFNRKSGAGKPIVIVSGLPRSGTSMMMKMLVEGGLQAITDGIRRGDEDNPNGYFEFETVKQLPQGNIAWLDDAGGKVVKVISSLLEFLPSRYSYKIIFMEREINEILASQKKMLDNRKEENKIEDDRIRREFQDHLAAVRAWLVRQPNIEVLYLRFNDLMKDPIPYCTRIAEFIQFPIDTGKMMDIPNKKLYRNRTPEQVH